MTIVDLRIKEDAEKINDFLNTIYQSYPEQIDDIIFIDAEQKCPMCKSAMKYQEITSTNPEAMTWCSNKYCDYRYNQFFNYKDFSNMDSGMKW